MRFRNWWVNSAVAALALALSACGSSDKAYVTVRASDASAFTQALGEVSIDDYESIELNVVSVRLRIKEEERSGKGKHGGWYEVPLTRFEQRDGAGVRPGYHEDRNFVVLDLVRLLRDKGFILAEGEVPAGVLTQIRFVLDSKEQGWAYPKGSMGRESMRQPVFVPSGSQSGLKLTGAKFHLEAGEEKAVELQFDARASVREHRDGALRIRPVVKLRNGSAVPLDSDDD